MQQENVESTRLEENVYKNTITHDKAIKYYQLVKIMANLFSKDNSTKVGALFIAPVTHEILTLGYNGMPRGVNEKDSTRWERPQKYEYTEHAERNAIYNAARTGTSLINSICVVTLFPCSDCARGIIQSGAKMVISLDPFKVNDEETIKRWGDKWTLSQNMLEEADVKIYYLDRSDVEIDLENKVVSMLSGLVKEPKY